MTGARHPFRVVVAGGGPAAVELLLALRDLTDELVEVELVAPSREFVYQPLAVARPFGAEPPQRFPLARIAEDCRALHTVGSLVAVQPEEHRVRMRDGSLIHYDALVVATGARVGEAVPGTLGFFGRHGQRAFKGLLEDIDAGRVQRLVFALPDGPTWVLPLYELALLTARHCAARGLSSLELTLTTPEWAPLELFGRRASNEVEGLLEEAGVRVITGRAPVLASSGSLALAPEGTLAADAVVSLPKLEGPRLPGLPHDPAGFIPTRPDGRVQDVDGVYAAGDATDFPVKQGGLATQQADVVADAIAAAAGAPVDPKPFRPVLRGLLLTGGPPRYLRAELASGAPEASRAEVEPIWWPPSKIGGRHLSAYVARLSAAQSRVGDRLRVEVDDLEQLLN